MSVMDCTGIGIGIRSFCARDVSVRVISSCNRRRSTTLSDQLDRHFSSITIFLLFLSRLLQNIEYRVLQIVSSKNLKEEKDRDKDKDCLFHRMKTITRIHNVDENVKHRLWNDLSYQEEK